MVDYAQLTAAEPAKFRTAGDACVRLSAGIETKIAAVSQQLGVLSGAWTGGDQVGGTAAVECLRAQNTLAAAASNDLRSLGRALETLAESVERAQKEVEQAKSEAEKIPAAVMHDGTVIAKVIPSTHLLGSGLSTVAAEAQRAAKEAAAARLTERIADAVAKATEADATASTAIGGLKPADIGDKIGGGVFIPAGASPKTVRGWWGGLTSGQRQYLLTVHPDAIGRLDGVPAEYRDMANRFLLNEQIADHRDRIGEIEAQLRTQLFDDGELEDELATLKPRLEGLEKIDARLAGPELNYPWEVNGSRERGYLLLLDGDGDGKGIVSIGNPDTADNVFTLVPGMDNELNNLSDSIDRVDKMVYDAQQQPGGRNTAGIVWLGYDAPDVDPEVLNDKLAVAGADDFDRFQDGLRATHEGPPSRNTVVGHSYGSLLVGTAAEEHGLDVDQAIFLGSPGVGVDDVRDLRIDGGNVYSAVGEEDIIMPQHGPQPATLDADGLAGVKTMSTDGVVTGHSGYWDDDQTSPTGSRTNMALVITGNGDEVTPRDPDAGNHLGGSLWNGVTGSWDVVTSVWDSITDWGGPPPADPPKPYQPHPYQPNPYYPHVTPSP